MKKLFNRIFQKIIEKYVNTKILNKKFSTYLEALSYCNKINKINGYNNGDFVSYRLNKFLNYQKISKKTNSSFLSSFFYDEYLLLIESVLIFIKENQKLPKILDYGGEFGDAYHYLKSILKQDFNYLIVESDQVVENSKHITGNKVEFSDNLSEAIKNFNPDILFSSGTLQMIEDYESIIGIFLNSNASIISLTKNSFAENCEEDNYYIIQPTRISDHGHGKFPKNINNDIVLFPFKSICEKKVVNILTEKYSIYRESNGVKGYHGNNTYSKDIIFKKF